MSVQLHLGDCLEFMRGLPDGCVDAVITDPPYGLKFMGKLWDHGVPGKPFWVEALRVSKPGAYLLAFGGTRTYHRLMCAIEDAGWEIRDTIAWVYGSGFPKSLDVSKAIDREAGAERVMVGTRQVIIDRWTAEGRRRTENGESGSYEVEETTPSTPAARQWDGWGTALKPAFEPIVVARKPIDGTVAHNVLTYGTGAINVDGCRVATDSRPSRGNHSPRPQDTASGYDMGSGYAIGTTHQGRWPANLIHDGSDEVLAVFPETTSGATTRERTTPHAGGGGKTMGGGWSGTITEVGFNDTGSTASFFYCAKASKEDRDSGLDALPVSTAGECTDRTDGTAGLNSPRAGAGSTSGAHNHHPTVKPHELMKYLCRLVTPPGGVILDPFMGSGSTGKGAVPGGFSFIGCDKSAEYVEIARLRIADMEQHTEEEHEQAQRQPPLFTIDAPKAKQLTLEEAE